MPFHYQFDGLAHGPVLVFSNALGANLTMWDWVLPKLRPHFRILRYDTRGQGQSEVTPGPYTLAQLGQDVIDLLDAQGIQKAHVCGLSLGGLTAQWLGIHHGHRLNKLVVSNTAARVGTIDGWNDRIDAVTANGVSAIAPAILSRWITEPFKHAHPDIEAKLLAMIGSSPAAGYAACCAALRDADLRDQIHQITVPTLVIAGQHDAVTTVADGQFIGQEVPNALLRQLPAAHLSAIEAADAFADTLLSFLGPSNTALFDEGMATRRAVLGDAHVDRANASINKLNADFQAFTTRYAWGDIWTRPGG